MLVAYRQFEKHVANNFEMDTNDKTDIEIINSNK